MQTVAVQAERVADARFQTVVLAVRAHRRVPSVALVVAGEQSSGRVSDWYTTAGHAILWQVAEEVNKQTILSC